MEDTFQKLEMVFKKLDRRIELLNAERAQDGGMRISRAEIKILGQMSLLLNRTVSTEISLAETGDLDAFLVTEYAVIREMRALLAEVGFVYDDLSAEIWLPAGARFEPLFQFTNVVVTRLDPESALTSKAIKAPKKNRMLIQDALASHAFSGLAERIEKNGGNLSYFLEVGK